MLTALDTTADVQRHKTTLAILPVGATEQHSEHLPLATDSLAVEAVSRGVAERLDAYCLPTLPYSISHMHRGSRGTVWLRNQTLAAVVRDIALAVRHEGFRQFVILNGHGGNFILVPIVQDLNLDYPDLLTTTLDIWAPIPGSGIFQDPDPLMHADEFETSVVLHLNERAVRKGKVRDRSDCIDRELLRYFPIKRIARRTHAGHPTRATAEKGRQALTCMIEHAVRSIRSTLEKVERVKKKR